MHIYIYIYILKRQHIYRYIHRWASLLKQQMLITLYRLPTKENKLPFHVTPLTPYWWFFHNQIWKIAKSLNILRSVPNFRRKLQSTPEHCKKKVFSTNSWNCLCYKGIKTLKSIWCKNWYFELIFDSEIYNLISVLMLNLH